MNMLAENETHSAMVSLRGISKNYGDVRALYETELDVRKGEFLTLLGPSGSGKTTLLNVVSGMQYPTTGNVLIAGRDVTSVPPAKRGIGMVFQNYALMPHMTVFENIAFPLQIRRVSKDEIKKRVTKVLELVELPDVADRKPKELSGGQQQRVSIARCIVYDPSLILMDEPLGALDKKLREQMQLEIKRIHEESGITVMYVTHDQEEALNMSDRIILMKDGKIEQLGTPSELYTNPVSAFAADFIGQSTLLDAVVEKSGSQSQIKIGTSEICRVKGNYETGRQGKLLLRPETLRIVSPDEVPEGHNSIEGSVSNTLITGGTAKHFVKLRDGQLVVVLELTRQNMESFQAEKNMKIVWPFEAGQFLEQ